MFSQLKIKTCSSQNYGEELSIKEEEPNSSKTTTLNAFLGSPGGKEEERIRHQHGHEIGFMLYTT